MSLNDNHPNSHYRWLLSGTSFPVSVHHLDSCGAHCDGIRFKFERRFCQICNLSPWLQATKVVQMHINLAIPPGNAWLKHWWDSGSCGTSSGTLYTKNLHKQQTCRSHLQSLFLTPVHHEFASWHTCTQSHSFVMYFSNVEASSSKELWFFM